MKDLFEKGNLIYRKFISISCEYYSLIADIVKKAQTQNKKGFVKFNRYHRPFIYSPKYGNSSVIAIRCNANGRLEYIIDKQEEKPESKNAKWLNDIEVQIFFDNALYALKETLHYIKKYEVRYIDIFSEGKICKSQLKGENLTRDDVINHFGLNHKTILWYEIIEK